jgi:hypothetical protein
MDKIDLDDINNVKDMAQALSSMASKLKDVGDSMPSDAFNRLSRTLSSVKTTFNQTINAAQEASENYGALKNQIDSVKDAISALPNSPESEPIRTRYLQDLTRLTQEQVEAARIQSVTALAARSATAAAIAALRNDAANMDALFNKAEKTKKGMGALKEATESLLSKIPGVGQLINLIGRFGLTPMAGLAGAAGLIIGIVRRFYELDMAAKKFRENTGLLTSQMKFLAKDAREINLSLADYGVSIDDAYNAQAALYGAFQTTALITKESALNLAKWSVNLGLAVADVAKIKSLFTSISASLGLSIDDTVLLGVHLAKAGGVAPAQVMKDVAESSEAMLMFMAKSPLALVRATVEARRLGTTIKSVAESAKGFLNYQESISSELEASAIVGVNLNFQRARELAFDKKIIQSRKEALRVIEEGVDFTNLSYYAQEQVAKAAQMTAEEIIKMQNQRKMLNALESSGLARDIELTKKWKKALQDVEDVQNGITGDILEQARAAANVADRQARIEMLTNKFRAAVDRLTDAFMPLAEELFPQLESFVDYVVDQMNALQVAVRTNADGIRLLVDALKIVFTGILFIGKEFVAAATDVATLVYAITDVTGRLLRIFGLASNASSKINDQSRRTNTTLSQTERITDRVNRNLQEAANSGLPEALDRVRYNQDEINQSQERGRRGLIWTAYTVRAQLQAQFAAWATIPSVLNSIIKVIRNVGVKILRVFNINPMDFINKMRIITDALSTFFENIKKPFDAIKNSAWVGKLSAAFTKLKTVGGSFLDFFGKYAKYIPIFGKLGLAVGRIALFFGKWITPIGWIYTAVEAIYFSFKRFGALFDSSEWKEAGFVKSIWLGLKTVGLVLYDVLVSPFVKAYEAIKDWLGSSPSPLGLKIVEGIASSGKMILENLISPFSKAWNIIKEWRGPSPSILGLLINAGISASALKIFNSLISPFSRAWRWLKDNRPSTDALFGSPRDMTAGAVQTVTQNIETRISGEVNIAGIREFNTSANELVRAINILIQYIKDTAPKVGDSEKKGTISSINNNPELLETLKNLDNTLNRGITAVMDPRAAASSIASATT